MSKLLKRTIAKHRPHIAARLTKANGYDESKHLLTKDLHSAGLIDDGELADLDGCVDDLVTGGSAQAGALKAAGEGRINGDKLNDLDFIKSLMAVDSDEGDDDVDGDDDGTDGDDSDEDVRDGVAK